MQALLTMAKCDIAFASDAASVVGTACACAPAVDGIMHAGGVLKASGFHVVGQPADAAQRHALRGIAVQDGLIADQTAAGMQLSFGAKIGGAAKLAAVACGRLPIASSAAFSSIAGLLGSAGQSNYAAANAVLDAWASCQAAQVGCRLSLAELTEVSRSWFMTVPMCVPQGIASVSLQWGPWAGSGMAAAEGPVLARLARLGLGAVQPQQGITALQRILAQPVAHAQEVGARLLWDRLLVGERTSMPFYAEFAASVPPSTLRTEQAAVHAPAAPAAADAAAPPGTTRAAGERHTWMQAAITQAVASIVGAQLGPNEALMNAGLDSIGAVELRKELARVTLIDLPATLMFDYPSIAELTGALLGLAPQPPAQTHPGGNSAAVEMKVLRLARISVMTVPFPGRSSSLCGCDASLQPSSAEGALGGPGHGCHHDHAGQRGQHRGVAHGGWAGLAGGRGAAQGAVTGDGPGPADDAGV